LFYHRQQTFVAFLEDKRKGGKAQEVHVFTLATICGILGGTEAELRRVRIMPGIRRCLLLILLLASLTGSVPLACGPREVHFPDPALETVIRERIKKPEGAIFPSDLRELTTIILPIGSHPVISDLTGLEYCVNLDTLHLEGHNIRDLSPLVGLTNLTMLWLQYSENKISDLSPLAGLTNLTTLGFPSNEIIDISPLASLANLTYVYLDDNQISDVSPLATLTSLIELYLPDNQISDISPLAHLTNLTTLGLDGNQIKDISPLASLNNLTSLNLVGNQIKDISSLASLTNLTYLSLGGNQVTDISPLSSLTNLKWVSLYDNPLSSASVNIYIPQLEEKGVRVLLTN
jgi:hypothetical protein